MSTEGSASRHILPEEVCGFAEKTLPRKKLREIEQHLCECMECLEYLGSVMRSFRPRQDEEQEPLGRATARSPSELLARMKPYIVATSPASQPRSGPGATRRNLLLAAAALIAVIALFAGVQTLLVAPARSRQMAAQAMAALVKLRQGTGRVPLRYIPGFQRARVTRSSFDTGDPNEDLIEARLRRAVELGPRVVESHVALGLFMLDTGRLEEAERHLSQALSLDPDSIVAKNGLAVVCYERALRNPSFSAELYRKGLDLLRDARREDPTDLQVAFNLAKFMEAMGSPAVAIEAWKLYLEQDDTSEWAEVALENLEALADR